jgi:Holliday junction resolvase RusA-like endonuclease
MLACPMSTILVSVKGIPRPQPRPRFVRGRVISTADANAKRWIATVEVACRAARDVAGKVESPVAAVLHFRFPSKDKDRHGQPHTSRPDADNLAKLVLDAAMRVGLIGDDSCVARLLVMKSWSDEPGLEAAFAHMSEATLETPASLDRPGWLN